MLNCAKYYKIPLDPKEFTVRLADANTFMCLKCKLVATSQESVTAHINTNHQIPSKFYCTKCKNWSRKSRKEVIEHWEECNGSIECADCDQEFESRELLAEHNQEFHPQRLEPGSFQCDECCYCTREAGNFRRHVKTGM